MIFFYSFKDYTLQNCMCYIKNLKSKISKLNYQNLLYYIILNFWLQESVL